MWWANGGAQEPAFGQAHIDSELAEDFAVFGLEDEIADVPVLNEQEAAALEPKFAVWPENVTTVRAFQALQTQWWEIAVDGKFIKRGLRYEAIKDVLEMTRKIKRRDWPDIFDGLRQMEDAALIAFSEQRKKRTQ